MLFDLIRNLTERIAIREQEFDELLASKNIDRIKDKMYTHGDDALAALKEYDTFSHEIMQRPDKLITDKSGAIVRREKTWKLPIPYPVYINEISVVFLYGRPVKWLQLSQGTDEAFARFLDVIKSTRFDAKIRQCKRIAGAETEAALLFRVFKNTDGTPDVQLRVLAKSKGDEIYTRFDQYENLISVAWGYYVKEEQDRTVYHFDIFTPEIIYRCARRNIGWDVETEVNLIGKIPIIYFRQEKEWHGVEHLIHREEYIASKTADTNDYYSDPMLLVSAGIVKNMPEKGEAAKTLITNDEDGVDNAAKFLTWDNAPQSKLQEIEWLQEQILTKTFTPNITLDTLKSVSQLSAKALRTVMMLADIKASRHKEIHDELLDRTASLIVSIIGNVLDVSLAKQCNELKVAHEWSEPFGEDVAEDLSNIVKAVEAGIMSTEGGIEMNPLVRNVMLEKDRIAEEQSANAEQNLNIFQEPAEDKGAQSAFD